MVTGFGILQGLMPRSKKQMIISKPDSLQHSHTAVTFCSTSHPAFGDVGGFERNLILRRQGIMPFRFWKERFFRIGL